MKFLLVSTVVLTNLCTALAAASALRGADGEDYPTHTLGGGHRILGVSDVTDPAALRRFLLTGFTTYPTRAAFLIAIGGPPDWTVDFSSFTTPTYYSNTQVLSVPSVVVGGGVGVDVFSLRASDVPTNSIYKQEMSAQVVDGEQISMDFIGHKVSGWGGDFKANTNGGLVDLVTDIICPGGTVQIGVEGEGFFGYTLDSDGAMSMVFESRNGEDEVFQLDNIIARKMRESGGMGDPHFLTWDQVWFDYMGECDLVMVDAPGFGEGLGLSAHARTKARYDYSFIESAALKIGDDTLQVSSWGTYFLNGVADAKMPAKLSGFPVEITHVSKKEHVFEVHIGNYQIVELRAYKDLVSIKFLNAKASDFGSSKGLMGSFENGSRFGRDGKTIMADDNGFGQEWQARDTDPNLFVTASGPQFPQQCALPSPTQEGRRLLEGGISQEAAEDACSHLTTGREQCVYDVMVTNDFGMAQAGGF